MSLANPTALWLLLLVIPIVAVYLKYSSPARRQISFSGFWWSLAEQTNTHLNRWAWLRSPLSLLVQLMILGCLILGAAGATMEMSGRNQSGTQPANLILVIDNSASMQAVDLSPSRFERAREFAKQLVRETPQTTRITLIPTVPNTTQQISLSSDRLMLEAWLDALQAADAPEYLEYVTQRLSASMVVSPESRVFILSDHDFLNTQQRLGGAVSTTIALNPERITDTILFNNNGNNVGIIDYRADLVSDSSDVATIYLTIRNFAAESVQFQLITHADAEEVDSRQIAMEPDQSLKLKITANVGESQLVSSQITQPERPGSNHLHVDDRAFCLLPDRTKTPVLVVSSNLFLIEAVQAIPWVSMTVNAENPPVWPTKGMIVLDSPAFVAAEKDEGTFAAIEAKAMPAIPVIVINPRTSSPFWHFDGLVEGDSIIRRTETDSLTTTESAWSYLDGIVVQNVARLSFNNRPMTRLSAIMKNGEDTSFVATIPVVRTNWTVVAASFADSDFVLQPAFPILVSQLLWESSARSTTTTRPLSAGKSTLLPERFEANDGATEIRARIPPLYRTGLHQLDSLTVCVNLNSVTESDVRSKAPPTADVRSASEVLREAAGTPESGFHSFALIAGLVTMILICMEWFMFQRQMI